MLTGGARKLPKYVRAARALTSRARKQAMSHRYVGALGFFTASHLTLSHSRARLAYPRVEFRSWGTNPVSPSPAPRLRRGRTGLLDFQAGSV